MTAIIVSTCLTCPFVSQDGERPLLCTVPSHEDDLPGRVIERDNPPPAWCSLREADRLVTLRLQ